jgi:hypothetical protein
MSPHSAFGLAGPSVRLFLRNPCADFDRPIIHLNFNAGHEAHSRQLVDADAEILSSTFRITTGTLVASHFPSCTFSAFDNLALASPFAVISVISLVPIRRILARSANEAFRLT